MFQVRPGRLVVTLVVLFAILGAGSVAAVAQGNSPQTEAVFGTFTASPVNVMQRTCSGQDGLYLELRGKFAGAITSSDPRLSGVLEFMSEPALVNLATGLGTFQGPFSITDPTTGMQKARGEFHTVVTEGRLNHGFALGKVLDQGAVSSDDFSASFKSTLDASLNVAGEFGGVSDPRTPAVIQGGHCSGPFTRVP